MTKLKRGYVREDGMVFWCYHSGDEYWISKEKFEIRSKKARENATKWNRNNRDRYLVHKKNSDRKHEARRSRYLQKWRTENRLKFQEIHRKWCENNRHRLCELQTRKRARKKDAIPDDVWWQAVISNFAIARRISKCLGIPHVVDHIYPLARGGSHCHRNLQVIPAALNQAKHAKIQVSLPSCYRSDGWGKLGAKAIQIQ